MARRVKLTKTDPEFLQAVSDALTRFKEGRGGSYTNARLAADLGVDASTVAKYIKRKAPMMSQTLARACVDLGISFCYRGVVISAGMFPLAVPAVVPSSKQLEFAFDAEYSSAENSWRREQRNANPMEFTLRVKIAS